MLRLGLAASFVFDARGVADKLTLFTLLAPATLVGCLMLLRQARELLFSSTFVSCQEL